MKPKGEALIEKSDGLIRRGTTGAVWTCCVDTARRRPLTSRKRALNPNVPAQLSPASRTGRQINFCHGSHPSMVFCYVSQGNLRQVAESPGISRKRGLGSDCPAGSDAHTAPSDGPCECQAMPLSTDPMLTQGPNSPTPSHWLPRSLSDRLLFVVRFQV